MAGLAQFQVQETKHRELSYTSASAVSQSPFLEVGGTRCVALSVTGCGGKCVTLCGCDWARTRSGEAAQVSGTVFWLLLHRN
jgi:hypothetical protein